MPLPSTVTSVISAGKKAGRTERKLKMHSGVIDRHCALDTSQYSKTVEREIKAATAVDTMLTDGSPIFHQQYLVARIVPIGTRYVAIILVKRHHPACFLGMELSFAPDLSLRS